MSKYAVGFPSPRVEKEFHKQLKKLSRNEQLRIAREIDKLSENPRPGGKKFKFLKGDDIIIFQFVAQYRLRVGDYRIFYDVDEARKRVVLLWVDKRSEKTYKF